MKKILAITLFTLATLAWAAAQQPGSTSPSSGQTTSPSSQTPGAGQSQPSTPGSADEAAPQAPASSASITEGCLGGNDPNYTITDKTGTAYKLNLPANAKTSSLASHVGESVQVKGNVNDSGKTGNSSIDVQAIGRGTGNCPGSGSKGTQSPPK